MKNRIKELRKAKGFTIAQLAEKVGLSTTHVSNIENHQRGLEVGWLEPFAKALGVSPVDLLEGSWNTGGISNSGNFVVGKNNHINSPNDQFKLDEYEKELITQIRCLNVKDKILFMDNAYKFIENLQGVKACEDKDIDEL